MSKDYKNTQEILEELAEKIDQEVKRFVGHTRKSEDELNALFANINEQYVKQVIADEGLKPFKIEDDVNRFVFTFDLKTSSKQTYRPNVVVKYNLDIDEDDNCTILDIFAYAVMCK